MSSNGRAEGKELELRLAEEDLRGLRDSARPHAMAPEEYLRFLARFTFSYEALRARPGPGGVERFSL